MSMKNNKLEKNKDNSKNKENLKNSNIAKDTKKNVQIKSVDGFNCIGPCYPPNTIYYNPLSFTPIKAIYPSCPIKKTTITNENNQKEIIFSDKCYEKDIGEGHIYFDIFNDSVQIANTPDIFLKQIYSIKNMYDVVVFLNSSIDNIPIYSQRRLLMAIYEVYYKYVEFPKQLFLKKIIRVLKQIYKITQELDEKKVGLELDKLDKLDNLSKSNDIYAFLIEKYH